MQEQEVRQRWRTREGESAVITGGSSGIGKASAELFLLAGGSVVLADVDVENGEKASAEFCARFKPGGGAVTRAVFVKCDTRVRSDLEASIAAAHKLGKFTVMFNNAGVIATSDTLEDASDGFEALLRVIDINVAACCLGTYLALEAFDPSRGGEVVTTASMAGLLPVGAPPIYTMSKAANIHFTRAIASALGEDSKSRIYALCPGYTVSALAPDPEVIKAVQGGVLTPIHSAEGFMMLVEGDLPNGSVMRVTTRKRGKTVCHDLVAWGKELGGSLPPRAGVMLQEAPLEEYTGPLQKEKPSLDVMKLSKI